MTDALKFGILNSICGIIVGLIYSIVAIGDDYEIMIFGFSIANFLIAFFLWKLIIGKRKATIVKTTIVGILSGIINHYLCWIVVSCISYSGYLIRKFH
jgi:hypothetical protein